VTVSVSQLSLFHLRLCYKQTSSATSTGSAVRTFGERPLPRRLWFRPWHCFPLVHVDTITSHSFFMTITCDAQGAHILLHPPSSSKSHIRITAQFPISLPGRCSPNGVDEHRFFVCSIAPSPGRTEQKCHRCTSILNGRKKEIRMSSLHYFEHHVSESDFASVCSDILTWKQTHNVTSPCAIQNVQNELRLTKA
jgi:hypothetical protein